MVVWRSTTGAVEFGRKTLLRSFRFAGVSASQASHQNDGAYGETFLIEGTFWKNRETEVKMLK